MNGYIENKEGYYYAKDSNNNTNQWVILAKPASAVDLPNFVSSHSGLTSYVYKARKFDTEEQAAIATTEQSEKLRRTDLSPFPLSRILELL